MSRGLAARERRTLANRSAGTCPPKARRCSARGKPISPGCVAGDGQQCDYDRLDVIVASRGAIGLGSSPTAELRSVSAQARQRESECEGDVGVHQLFAANMLFKA